MDAVDTVKDRVVETVSVDQSEFISEDPQETTGGPRSDDDVGVR